MSKQERFLFKDEIWITEQSNLFATWWKESSPEQRWLYNTEDGWAQSWDQRECLTPEVDTVYSKYKQLERQLNELIRIQKYIEEIKVSIESLPKLERL